MYVELLSKLNLSQVRKVGEAQKEEAIGKVSNLVSEVSLVSLV